MMGKVDVNWINFLKKIDQKLISFCLKKKFQKSYFKISSNKNDDLQNLFYFMAMNWMNIRF